jgi:hypothetical protein
VVWPRVGARENSQSQHGRIGGRVLTNCTDVAGLRAGCVLYQNVEGLPVVVDGNNGNPRGNNSQVHGTRWNNVFISFYVNTKPRDCERENIY